ncbi:caspase-3 [Kryptolebias marmoratus]|uniref:Caspase-3 n=1 Tax=Kryptolebias marmoratus TaxID=37003 RepID=A0A3Q3AFY4_KRYMA|nr:caspase-3 [Kryptolebias marmoratus]
MSLRRQTCYNPIVGHVRKRNMAEVPGGNEGQDAVDALSMFGKSFKSTAAGDGKVEEMDSKSSSSAVKLALPDKYNYKMDYPCLGTCLIINNKNFNKTTGMNCRHGTDADAGSVMKTFKGLGYATSVFNDQTVDEMKSLMNRVAREDHSKSASFVCVLLSHGEEGVIYGTDGYEKIDTLIKPFKEYSCRSLVGKPKLFFIQACRGSLLDDGVMIETDAVQDETVQKIPVEADFLYAYSTAPGFYSWRNTSNGSWFIQSLCAMLERFKGELDLMQILTRVNNMVASNFESSSNLVGFSEKKQIPCIVSMLTKDFYFPK